jgi:uncharacterized membrane protein YjgN (DUF898 family)
VLFRGRIVEGFDREQVKTTFGRLFKLDQGKLDALFSQGKVVLKKSVSKEEASRIASKLRGIGMLVELRPLANEGVPKTAPTPVIERKPIPKLPPLKENSGKAADLPVELSLMPDSVIEKRDAAEVRQRNAEMAQGAFSGLVSAGDAPASYNNEYEEAFDGPVVRLPKDREVPFVFNGNGKEYFRIWVVNVFLTIITLGIYSAWAKVRTKRYFYGNTSLDGSSFEYLGDPIKILKGRLIAFFFLAIFVLSEHISLTLKGIVLLLLMIATPWVVSRALRFRNYNSAWRGIRFGFEGGVIGAAISYLWWPAISIIGVVYPFLLRSQTQYVIGNSNFGGVKMENSTTIGEFYKIFWHMFAIIVIGGFITAILAGFVPSVGLPFIAAIYFSVFILYRVKVTNLKYGNTTIGPHSVMAQYELKSYAWLVLTNMLGIILTLGFFYPFAKVRTAHYAADHIGLIVRGDLDKFVSDQRDAVSAVGEGVGDLFDFDIGF